MNVAILGGTGKEGSGLAMRWALGGHAIIIGSRDAARAHDKAIEMRERTKKLTIVGKENAEAAALGDIVVVALPAAGLSATLPPAREACRGKVVVSTVVPPAVGSSAEEVQALLPEANVVAAFHHIAAHELAEAEHDIECDLLMCGADVEAKAVVTELGTSMGLHVIDVGPLTNAGPLEAITAVLATINRRYKLKNSGIKITG